MKKIKVIPRENLIIRQSMSMFFGNGEIWFEQLDALSIYKDVVSEKFLADLKEIRRPSTPALIAVNLNETEVDSDLAKIIADGLCDAGKSVRKVVFVGLDMHTRSMMKRALSESENLVEFVYTFINDYENAKKWLVS